MWRALNCGSRDLTSSSGWTLAKYPLLSVPLTVKWGTWKIPSSSKIIPLYVISLLKNFQWFSSAFQIKPFLWLVLKFHHQIALGSLCSIFSYSHLGQPALQQIVSFLSVPCISPLPLFISAPFHLWIFSSFTLCHVIPFPWSSSVVPQDVCAVFCGVSITVFRCQLAMGEQ